MRAWSDSIPDGSIPERLAFARADADHHTALSDNRNPHLAWDDVPDGAASFVVIGHDGDVPTMPDDVNQEGREVPPDLRRTDFYHWVLVDLPVHVRNLGEGAVGSGVVAHGRTSGEGPHGSRQGINDYTGWFSGDPEMEGDYYGYDGPCPPWNDSLVHHYVFTVYALDLARLPVEGAFSGPAALAAMEGHILAAAAVVGTYTLNPRLRD